MAKTKKPEFMRAPDVTVTGLPGLSIQQPDCRALSKVNQLSLLNPVPEWALGELYSGSTTNRLCSRSHDLLTNA